MDYKPFQKYSDISFDQTKFKEASTLAKAKRNATGIYNGVLQKAPAIATGVAVGGTLLATDASINNDPFVLMGVAGVAGGLGDMAKNGMNLHNTQASLSDDIKEHHCQMLFPLLSI